MNDIPLDEKAIAYYGATVAVRIARGTMEMWDWDEELVREFGEELRPHLTSIRIEAERWRAADIAFRAEGADLLLSPNLEMPSPPELLRAASRCLTCGSPLCHAVAICMECGTEQASST